jgi:hypothetical protein
MRTIRYHLSLCAAAACLVLTSGLTVAQEGVVRISDATQQPNAAAQPNKRIQPAGFLSGSCSTCNAGCGTKSTCCATATVAEGCCQTECCPTDGCQTNTCQTGCWNPKCKSDCCMCQNCCCNGRNQCGCVSGSTNCLFAGSECSGTGCKCRDFWRGQSMSFRAKNSRLADHLFGWMVPSGCCGKGCPPVGAYQITYADQPHYNDARDNKIYAAQGYGMPMTVPLAPNVNYSYNYSAGMPSSRITPISNFNPQTSPQPLYHQSW